MFYLNGANVQEPAGWAGVYWIRVRNPEYFGIWRQRTATIKGLGEVGFEQGERDYLRSLWAKHGANAVAHFEVKENEKSLYSADIDFGIWSDDGRFFNVGFRDEDVELDTLADVVTGIDPQVQILLPQQAISEGIPFVIGKDFVKSFSGGKHSIPWTTTGNSAGNGISVANLGAVESIYRNGSDKGTTVRIEGTLLAKWSGSGTATIKLESALDGMVKDVKIVGSVPVSAVEQKIFLVGSIEVPAGYFMRLYVDVSGGSTIQYNDQSSMTIYEDSAVSSSFVWGLTWKQAIESLVFAHVGDSVKVSSRFLTTGRGAKRTITSERNLRGNRSAIQISLKALLKDMIAIENLAVWKRDGVLYIETKADMLKMVGRSRIEYHESLSHAPIVGDQSLPAYVSNISASYQNWQSGTEAGLDEFCSERTFTTEQKRIKASHSIQIDTLSASGKIMEALRRNISAEKADNDQDQRVFVIVAEKRGDYYVAITGNIDQVVEPANAINGDVSPREILKRWLPITGISGVAEFQSGSGNYTAIVNGELESAPLRPDRLIFTGLFVTIETGLSIKQFAELGEVVEYTDHDGTERSFLVVDGSYRFNDGTTILSGYQINE